MSLFHISIMCIIFPLCTWNLHAMNDSKRWDWTKCRRWDISIISWVTLQRCLAVPQTETCCVLIAEQGSQPGYTDWAQQQQFFYSNCNKTRTAPSWMLWTKKKSFVSRHMLFCQAVYNTLKFPCGNRILNLFA